jgi:hypothetical protein
MTEVYLAIYDLSQGMARNLSAQFLGPNHVIDMIPHTAILVFGKEYFFGGGIQAVDPQSFRASRGMHPVQTQRLGRTHVSQADFDAWCHSQSHSHSHDIHNNGGQGQFSAQSYDLLERNCNHFSHEAALRGLQLSQGVPEWILQVPQRFLSSPMGQMIRPMLEQMQVTTTAPVQAQPPRLPVAAARSVAGTTTATTTANPWANNAPPSSSSATTSTKPKASAETAHRPATKAAPAPPSILQKFTKPMISQDSSSVPLCIAKIAPHLTNDGDDNDDNIRSSLEQLGKALMQQKTNTNHATVGDKSVSELWRLLQEGNNTAATPTTTFVLLLLRLVVLHDQYYYPLAPALPKLRLEWLVQQLNDNDAWKTPASRRSLAWCVVSNSLAAAATATATARSSSSSSSSSANNNNNHLADSSSAVIIVEAAIRDLHHETVEVRQAASTVLYNYVLLRQLQQQEDQQQQDDDDDDDSIMVSILCATLESLSDEVDATTRLRRLVVAGRLVFVLANTKDGNDDDDHVAVGCNETAKALVRDLGFVEGLHEIIANHNNHNNNGGDTTIAKECQSLAAELVYKLEKN